MFSHGGTTACPQRNLSGIKRVANITDYILTDFQKEFIAIRLEWYYTEPHVCSIKTIVHQFFNKQGNKPDRSKLEKTGKMHTLKSAKHFRRFLGFPNFVK